MGDKTTSEKAFAVMMSSQKILMDFVKNLYSSAI
jgi:hypothetical protein